MLPQLKRGQQQNSVSATLEAPTGGINATSNIAKMPTDECIFSFNILPEDGGMDVRDGYVEHANGWAGDPARTVITFQGNVAADDKLWVSNAEGIWEVTVEGTTAPVQVFTWPSSVGDAGICSYVNFTNDGNDRFVLLCDGENGYHIWTQTTDLWEVGTFTGGDVDADQLNFVMIWKQRVWFVQKESANAWYLPPTAITGNLEEFNFGDQFRFGGALRSLHNWTLDGGNGIDDYLVAISGAGDVIIYQGTDPAAAESFGLVGSWYVGEVPDGNRLASEFSGELYVLSVQGLLPLSRVLNGAVDESPVNSITAKISPLIRRVMNTSLNEFGWQVHIHPKQSLLYINTPHPLAGQLQLAFTFYFGTSSWGIIRGLNKSHSANWKGDVYWTDITQNKIYRQAGSVDGVFIDQEVDGPPKAIDWQLLTSYQDFGEPARYKRCQYIRPMFVTNGVPGFNVEAHYDYDTQEVSRPPIFIGGASGIWNAGLWNVARWGGGITSSDNPRGANGMGRHMAVNIRGLTAERTKLIGFDIILDYGGLM